MKIIWKKVHSEQYTASSASDASRPLGYLYRVLGGWQIQMCGDDASATVHPTLWGAASSLKKFFA